MISANELRVGDLVKRDKHLLRVLQIRQDIVRVEFLDKSVNPNHMATELSTLDPIPLTEEILLKCGAIYDNTNGNHWFSVSALFYIELIPVMSKEFSIVIGAIDPTLQTEDRSRLCIKIKYLHRLQNLYFALTQTELEINL